MAKFDPEKVTQLMVERATGYASRETAAKELAEMTVHLQTLQILSLTLCT